MTPDSITFLPQGDHRPWSVCLAIIGPHRVPARWAVQAMHIQFPPMARRSLMCFVNDNLDTARNLALDEWCKAQGDLRSDWIAIVPSESCIRSDAVCAAIASSDPVTRAGETYVLHREAVEAVTPPWFVDGAWRGSAPRDRTQALVMDIFGSSEGATVSAPAPERETEANAAQTIVIAIPTLGTVALPWVVNAIALAPPMTCALSLVVAGGHAVDSARQKLANAVLEKDPRPAYMLFWGDDNLPPPDGLRLLLDTARQYNAPAVSGLYHIKCYPPVQPVMWRNAHPGPLIPGKDFQPGEILQVDGSGLDFVLIRTEALAALPALKFRTVFDWIEGRGMMVQTEDAFFWDRWREIHGRGPLVDTRCRVGHYSLLDGAVY